MSTKAPQTVTERQVAALGPAPQPQTVGEPKPPTTTERQVEGLLGKRP